MFLDDEKFVGRRLKGKKKNAYKTSMLSVNARLNKKRSARTQGNRFATVIALGSVAGLVIFGVGLKWAAAALFWENDRYLIQHLDIHSGRSISEVKIRQYTGISEGTNLFAVNIAQVRTDVLKKVPNVKNLEICRVLPDTMSIRVVERTPLARVGFRGGFAIDDEGSVFVPRHSMRGLPHIFGRKELSLSPGERADGRTLAALMVVEACGTREISFDVSSVDTDNRNYLVLKLANGKNARLPLEGFEDNKEKWREFIEKRLKKFNETLASTRGRRDSRFDLTFQDIRSWP